MRTTDLTGPALDWAVARSAGAVIKFGDNAWRVIRRDGVAYVRSMALSDYTPSTNWVWGGPIIEREQIQLECVSRANSTWGANTYGWGKRCTGPTPLIAAMRCYVASKLGDEVDVPEELK